HVALVHVTAVMLLQVEPRSACESSARTRAAEHLGPRLVFLQSQPSITIPLIGLGVTARVIVSLCRSLSCDGALQLCRGLQVVVVTERDFPRVHRLLSLKRGHDVFALPWARHRRHASRRLTRTGRRGAVPVRER